MPPSTWVAVGFDNFTLPTPLALDPPPPLPWETSTQIEKTVCRDCQLAVAYATLYPEAAQLETFFYCPEHRVGGAIRRARGWGMPQPSSQIHCSGGPGPGGRARPRHPKTLYLTRRLGHASRPRCHTSLGVHLPHEIIECFTFLGCQPAVQPAESVSYTLRASLARHVARFGAKHRRSNLANPIVFCTAWLYRWS